jgi:hypothetical protein
MITASENNETFEYRVAFPSDANSILAVLKEVASEIPVVLDTQDKLARITTVTVQCCVSKETWVACDADGNIVGVVLAEPNRRKRDGSIHLPYIGVSKDKRQRGIFGTLVKKLMNKGAPLTASVLHGNQSGMADRLVKLGFTKEDSDDEGTRLKWKP